MVIIDVRLVVKLSKILREQITMQLANSGSLYVIHVSLPKLPREGHVLLPKNQPQGHISGEILTDQKGYMCICGAGFSEPNAAHNGKLHIMRECYIYACLVCGERCKRQGEAKDHCADGSSRRRRRTQARTDIPSYNRYFRMTI
ncbi:hypothetical protein M422DRAFT_46169 [Sphaerobolus stellatus SS14]|nr:hypothetical protein M422DRAFT_46169 [Sphaerobolus stellatus SS14]